MTTTKQVKCALCNVELEGPSPDTDPQGMYSCPLCGNGDTMENVVREIGEYTASKMADRLAVGFEQAVHGSKSVAFRKENRPQKIYRFIIDLDL